MRRRTRFFVWIAAVVLALGCASGCKEKPDVEQEAEKASSKANEALDTVGEAVDSAAAATTLTPRLKTAITADPDLNDPKNHINIDSNDERVTIDGHVETAALKARAEKIVREEMRKANATQTVVNNLHVGPTKENGD
jgi:osmotically-inducible protein OsmY